MACKLSLITIRNFIVILILSVVSIREIQSYIRQIRAGDNSSSTTSVNIGPVQVPINPSPTNEQNIKSGDKITLKSLQEIVAEFRKSIPAYAESSQRAFDNAFEKASASFLKKHGEEMLNRDLYANYITTVSMELTQQANISALEIQSLKSQIQQLKSELRVNDQEVNSFQIDLNVLSSKSKQLDEQINDLENELSSFTYKINIFSWKQSDLRSLQAQSRTLKDQTSILQQKIDYATNKRREVSQLIANMTTEIQDLRDGLSAIHGGKASLTKFTFDDFLKRKSMTPSGPI